MVFFFFKTQQILALTQFNYQKFIYEWLQNGINEDVKEYQVNDEFKYGTPLALDSLLNKSPKWVLIKKIHYLYSMAAPIEELSILSNQHPKKIQTVSPEATYYLQSKINPDIRIVLETGNLINFGTGGLSTKIYCTQRNIKDAIQLRNDLESELINNSGYRGGILELTKTGLIQFLPNIENLNSDWAHLIVHPELKSNLIEVLDGFLKNYDYEKWKKLGISLSQGALIYGPPGTGKTFLAKVLISNILQNRYNKKITYFHIQSRHISSPDRIRSLFNLARKMSPSIVFMEDIDLIAGTNRQNRPDIKNELLQQLNGIEELNGVLTIATTNYFDQIDPALKRSKRLGVHFNFNLPTLNERTQLLEIFLKSYPHEVINLDSISTQTDGFSGADLKQLSLSALEFAFLDLKKSKLNSIILSEEHFKKALELRKKTHLFPTHKSLLSNNKGG